MNTMELNLSSAQLQRLLGAANPDAALLYLYLQAGNERQNAPADLQMCDSRVSGAAAMLRQLGLLQDKKVAAVMGERPITARRM